MARASLTKRTIDAAKPTAVEYVVWDDEVSGFGLKVTPSGSKVYLYRYRLSRPGQASQTAPSKYTIGKHGSLTPDQARKRAKDLAALVAEGIDPRKQELETFAAMEDAKRLTLERARLENELAFDSVAEKWLAEYKLDHRPNSVAQGKRVIDLYLAPRLANKPLPHIGRADLQPIIDAIPPNMRATRQSVFAYASILFGWAHKRGDIAENPLTSMAKPRGSDARDRVLTDDELATIWTASVSLSGAFGGFVRLLILTGQRREEVAAMTWDELDRAKSEWIIPANRAKNGNAHIVPLSPAVVAELDTLAEWKDIQDDEADRGVEHWPKAGPVLTTNGIVPIRGFSKAKAALDAEITKARDNRAMTPWRIHDLRRTLATGFQRLGIRFEVTEATLNHVSGAKGGVAGIYQKHDWKQEKRAALEAWARHVEGIISPEAADNVVPLKLTKKQL
jgi:integrase